MPGLSLTQSVATHSPVYILFSAGAGDLACVRGILCPRLKVEDAADGERFPRQKA